MLKSNLDLFGVIGNNFTMDEEISDIDATVYTIIRCMFYDNTRRHSILSFNGLYEFLNIPSNQGKPTKQIKESVNSLIEKGYIEIYDLFENKINFNEIVSNMFKVEFINENNKDNESSVSIEGGFSRIPYDNIISLLKYTSKNKGIKKYQLIRQYLIISRVCSNQFQFGHCSIDKMKDVMGISATNFKDNNNILSELGLIFYNNDYGHVDKKGRLKMDCTMFGHCNVEMKVFGDGFYMDKETFKQFVDDYICDKKLVKVDKDKINSKRSETMKKKWAKIKADSS